MRFFLLAAKIPFGPGFAVAFEIGLFLKAITFTLGIAAVRRFTLHIGFAAVIRFAAIFLFATKIAAF